MNQTPEQKLAGKVALVTGASSGIGKATAWVLAEQGADVAINYLTWPEAAEELAEQIRKLGRRAFLYQVDISNQESVENMVQRIADDAGRLDIFVSNAAYSDRESFYQADMEGFRRTIDVTMWGAFHTLRAAANLMIRQGDGGNVVVVSSPHARIAKPKSMAYNMAKGALDQMARTAALELIEFGIRVNIIYPGWTDTGGERKFFSERALEELPKVLPVPRLGRPEEVARGVVFLVDPASEYVVGTTLSIDGGAQLPYWAGREEPQD